MMKRSIVALVAAALLGACSSSSHESTQQTVGIGSAAGSGGGEVTVPISLAKTAPNVVTIAPLVFEFDASTLSFEKCTPRVSGKSVDAVSPSPGRISFVMSGGVGVIPAGPIVDCTFKINPGAARGVSPLRFVRAGMADIELHDIAGTGSNGSVTVQ